MKTEISTGIGEVKGEIQSMKSAILGLEGSIIVAVLVVIIEFVFEKI